MRYLGLDLSTVSTGFSIFDDEKCKDSGKIVPDKNVETMERIKFIAQYISNSFDFRFIDKVIIEDTFYQANYLTTKMLNRLAGAVFFAIVGKKPEIKIEFVTPTAARKSVGLLPRSQKQNIVDRVNQMFNLKLELKDNDEADGIVLGYYGYWHDHEPKEKFTDLDKGFYKTKVRSMKTPKIKKKLRRI